jgi:predicted methyltransferase
VISKTVGPNGHVYALVPAGFAQRPGGLDALNALAAQLGNVTVVATDLTNFTLERPVDLAWTTENYHDMHNGPTPSFAGVNAAVFKALKPGGIYFVEDHAALAGAGPAVTQELHRIDPAQAIEEVTAAGFVLDAQSDLLKNPDDPKNVGVRDPSVQGETEKFALRFRKPG